MDDMALSSQARTNLIRLSKNLPLFSRTCLKIIDKEGMLRPFILNRAQELVHARLEEQLISRTPMVRAVILKARQMGFSTYIGARFFQKVLFNKYLSAFIVAHQAKSTQQLYRMVELFYKHLPPELKTLFPIATHNRNELEFAASGSRYIVGTAGSEEMGRGFTIQLLHASEVAFWADADRISTGLFRSVNRSPGTEIILESTANGVNNFFHNQFKAGLDEDSSYISIFVPWYLSPEYQIQPPSNFIPSEEEHELFVRTYKLTPSQIYWRRRVIQDECHGMVWKFNQEYPTCAEDAFVSSDEAFFDSYAIQQARKNKYEDPSAPKILGLDPASIRDRAAFAFRQGRKLHFIKTYRDKNTQTLAALAYKMHQVEKFDRIFVDVGNGYGVFDILKNDYKLCGIVTAVNFGAGAMLSDLYADKRAEMFFLIKEWFEGSADIPDEDSLHNELMCIPMPEASTVRGALRFKKKKDIRTANNQESTDLVDALGLTFAFPVASKPAQAVMQSGKPVCNGVVVQQSTTRSRFQHPRR